MPVKSIRAAGTAAAALAAAIFAGCTSFETERTNRFVDENRRFITVEYGKEAHETTFTTPTGVRLPFKSNLKVRVTAPDGRRFVAYQNMSVAGVLYKTDDGEWEYFEEGTGCALAERAPEGDGYILRFQGVICSMERNPDYEPKRPKIRSSAIPVIKGARNSSGPADAEGR